MWDLPGPGIKPVSPALEGRFLTTAPPGKSLCRVLVLPCRIVFSCDMWNLFFKLWHVGSSLQQAGSLVVACGIFSCDMQTLSCVMWDLVPWPRIEPGAPALGVQSLSHWTTREVPSFILLHVNIQFSHHHLLTRLSFLHCEFLVPSSKISWLYMCGVYFWTLCFVPLIYMSVFMPVPYCFDYYSFII